MIFSPSCYLSNAILDSNQLDSRQIYFVNQVVEYIVLNGLMKDFSLLKQPPFNNQGSIVDIFTDLSLWADIRKTSSRSTPTRWWPEAACPRFAVKTRTATGCIRRQF